MRARATGRRATSSSGRQRALAFSFVALGALSSCAAESGGDAELDGASGGEAGAPAGTDADSATGGSDGSSPTTVRPVAVARTQEIPTCALFVDAGAPEGGAGTVAAPYNTLAAAVAAAAEGDVICAAEGTYPEFLTPGPVGFTLAGGFQSGTGFTVRDSAEFVSRAQGDGTGIFLKIEDPAPAGAQLTAIDGFEITGYAQAIVRNTYYSQRFDITNCNIHHNVCLDGERAGGGFFLSNTSGKIERNVISNNICWRGGGGSITDDLNENSVSIRSNRVEFNEGTEPQSSHGGGLYLFAKSLEIEGNTFVGNSVTGWGGGLFVGAFTAGGQTTSAKLSWNTYFDNRAGNSGGGFFCDDSADCLSAHEIYSGNCGGNILLDSGPGGGGPTTARFNWLTCHGGLNVDCSAPGPGVQVTKGNDAPDSYAIENAIFWGNAPGADLVVSCDAGCESLAVSVRFALIQAELNVGAALATLGDGIISDSDPLFVSEPERDFHLQSTFGVWTGQQHTPGSQQSPALAKADPAADASGNPERAGGRSELGAYGNSAEASWVK